MKKFVALFGALIIIGVGLVLSFPSNAAGSTVRINAGGPATTVNGTNWTGCSSISSCNGYVTGGFPWAQSPPPAVSGYSANTTAPMHQKEWTGGQTNGIAAGATAFSFRVPVAANNDYQVILHFTELNKNAAGQRLFDVKLNDSTVLSNFDVFQSAGGKGKTIIRSFNVHDTSGAIRLAFIRRLENAKIDAIEIVPVTPASTTTSSSSQVSTTTSSTTTQPSTTTTSTTVVSPSGTAIKWSNIANPPYRSAESSGGIINNKFYLFGGFQPASWYVPTDSANVYDIATNTWAPLPNIPMGITHAGRVIDGNSFILAGGVDYVNGKEVWAVPDVLKFDTDTQVWSKLPPLPEARGSAGASLIGRDLHVFGGVDGAKNVHNEHWVLNLDDLVAGWRTAAPFPSPRSHFAAVVVNDNKIYTVGGMTGWENTTVEKKDTYAYDSATDSWSRLADMPVVRSHVSESTMVIGGNIWMFGGEPKYPNASNEIYVYDIAGGSWRKAAATLPQARFAGVADHIGTTVFFLNGTIYDSTSWRGEIS